MDRRVVNFRFKTASPDEASAHLTKRYSRFRIQAADPRAFAFEHTALGDDNFTIERLTFQARATASMDVTPAFVVGHLLGGRWSLSSGQQNIDVRTPVLYPHREVENTWHDLQLGVVTIAPDEVLEVARLLGAGPRFAFTGNNPVDSESASLWQAAVQHANRDVLGNPEFVANPLVRDEARHTLILALLRTFPNSTMESPRRLDVGAAPASVRRAVQYIEENAHVAVDIRGIAEASGLSVRGIQAAFRRTFDMSPLSYLRMVRLEAVRKELRSLERDDEGTVSSVAHSWGFVHLGRFAAQYRERFGEPPSTTRHR